VGCDLDTYLSPQAVPDRHIQNVPSSRVITSENISRSSSSATMPVSTHVEHLEPSELDQSAVSSAILDVAPFTRLIDLQVAADASGSTIQPSSENSTADSRTQVGKYDSGCHWIRASSAVIPFSLEFVILAPASGHVISEERSCKAQEVVLTRYIESASAANSISNYKPCPYLYQAPAAPLNPLSLRPVRAPPRQDHNPKPSKPISLSSCRWAMPLPVRTAKDHGRRYTTGQKDR